MDSRALVYLCITVHMLLASICVTPVWCLCPLSACASDGTAHSLFYQWKTIVLLRVRMPAVNYGSWRTGKCLIVYSELQNQQRQAVTPWALAGYVDILHNSLAQLLPHLCINHILCGSWKLPHPQSMFFQSFLLQFSVSYLCLS